jgi:D-glycero-D-manno-heptose 1,7-bisphosphate phosphatase
MSNKTIFLDRDGVINKESNYVFKIDDFEFIEGIFDACQYLQKLKYEIIIVTNQSGISRGFYNESDYQKLTTWMLSEFENNNIHILDIFHCPHGPDSNCNCRKPKPGMLIKAQIKHNIDMKNSWLIGDKASDILAANHSGIKNTIIVRSGHMINNTDNIAMFIIDSIKQVNLVIKK